MKKSHPKSKIEIMHTSSARIEKIDKGQEEGKTIILQTESLAIESKRNIVIETIDSKNYESEQIEETLLEVKECKCCNRINVGEVIISEDEYLLLKECEKQYLSIMMDSEEEPDDTVYTKPHTIQALRADIRRGLREAQGTNQFFREEIYNLEMLMIELRDKYGEDIIDIIRKHFENASLD